MLGFGLGLQVERSDPTTIEHGLLPTNPCAAVPRYGRLQNQPPAA